VQKTCHAADGLSKVPPVYVSRYYLWDSSDCRAFIMMIDIDFYKEVNDTYLTKELLFNQSPGIKAFESYRQTTK